MNIAEALAVTKERLKQAEVAEPGREAASLLAFTLARDATFLIAHPEYVLSSAEQERFLGFAARRGQREPFQYIVGRQEFYGLDFDVTPDVLIPRPETETLVEDAIGLLSLRKRPSFCEIGVGSGCISVSILKHASGSRAVATDISGAALAVALKNAERHEVGDRLELIGGDLFAGLSGTFDLIVSNPPYIASEDLETLQPEVRDFEPIEALSGGPCGLEIIERLIDRAPMYLAGGGHLLIEIGFDQSTRVGALFSHRAVWAEVSFLDDLQGIRRIAKARKQEVS